MKIFSFFRSIYRRTLQVIPGAVNKIVTTFKPATLCALSLGLAPKLIGVDTSSKRDRLSRAVFPGINQVTGIGSKSMGINFETLVTLEPDLVILYSQKDGIQMADRLADLNIPAIVILPETLGPSSFPWDLLPGPWEGIQRSEPWACRWMESLT